MKSFWRIARLLPEGLQSLKATAAQDAIVKKELSDGHVAVVVPPVAHVRAAGEGAEEGKAEEGKADEDVQENAIKAEEDQQEQVSPMDLLSQALAATTKVHGIGFPSHLRSSSWVQDFVLRMLDVEDEAVLNKNRLIWRRIEAAMAAMSKSLQGATTGLKKHLAKKEAEKTKKVEQDRATLDRERVQSQKQELGARARRLQQAAAATSTSSFPPSTDCQLSR